MPHNPVAVREQFMAATVNPKATFGAAVSEISWSTGEILNCLRKEKLTIMAMEQKADLGEWDQKGSEVRTTIMINNPQPLYK